MKSLTNLIHRRSILQRVQQLRPDSPRRWGRMTAGQMICHLSDSFRSVMRERPSTAPPPVIPRWRQRLMKLVALQLPLPWPHGVRTRPDVDQERGGTPPTDFEADVVRLVDACERFALGDGVRGPHFLFGPLDNEEWGQWGYRHMDHHLRQFGV